MRMYLAHFLSAVLLAGTVSACHSEPPPKAPRAKRVRKSPKVVKFDVVENVIRTPAVLFRTGTADLDPASEPALDIVLDYLTAHPEVTLLRIEGHTDSDGNAASNQGLSERRALAVAHWLVDDGIDCHRLIPVGFGQDKPIVPNTTAENKAQNRRVVFFTVNVGGKIIGSPEGGGRPAGDACMR